MTDMAKLVFLGKEFGGRGYNLRVEQTSVGRAMNNTLVIQHKSISSHHCEILNYGNEVIVRDLGSTNGTYVDDARLNQQSGVLSGQIIRFGDVEARLELDATQETSSEVTAIYDHARAVRDHRREQAKGFVDPKQILEQADSSHESDTHTLILPVPIRPDPSPPAPEPAAPAKAKKGTLGWWILGILLVAAGIAFVFLLR